MRDLEFDVAERNPVAVLDCRRRMRLQLPRAAAACTST